MLTSIKQLKKFRKGSVIYAPGEMPNCIYILVKGKMRILSKLTSDETCAARSLEPCEIFGLTEAIANLPYETSAETITSCTCECIRREDFIHFLQENPNFCFHLMKQLAQNLQNTYQSLDSTNI